MSAEEEAANQVGKFLLREERLMGAAIAAEDREKGGLEVRWTQLQHHNCFTVFFRLLLLNNLLLNMSFCDRTNLSPLPLLTVTQILITQNILTFFTCMKLARQ